VIPEISFSASTSILRFHSMLDLRHYLKRILDENLREMDKMSDAIALAMRDKRYDSEHPSVKGWVKHGNLFVNKDDPDKATLDLLFSLSREIKPRITQISDTLKTAEKLESIGVGDKASLLLYVRLGIPERVIVTTAEQPAPDGRFEFKKSFVTR
jgi:hypothetical protein